jgi:hypothetical protein
MTMKRRRRTEGHCQCLELSLAASGVYHRHAEEEEDMRKLVALETAIKQEGDAEYVD